MILNDKPILVAISCITYNHKDYLRQCLDGFVMQKTNFRFVAVVHDDCSTDGTTDILREYAAKHPDIILPLYEEENQYSKHNGAIGRKMHETFDRLRAKYIACCEGDDYWTDPLKLQKQVNFLEEHEEYSMCVSTANIEMNGKIIGTNRRHEAECDLTTDEVIIGTGLYVSMASTIYKRECMQDMPRWREMADVGDWPLHIQGTLVGKVHYFPEVMCTYRYQHAGSWTARNIGKVNLEHMVKRSAWLQALDEDTERKYHATICTVKMISDSVLFSHGRLPLKKYLHTVLQGKSKKKVNHIIKDLMLRYAGLDLKRK